MVVTT